MPLRKSAKKIALALGYEVTRLAMPRVVSGKHYGRVQPIATYSPWLDDQSFMTFHRLVETDTLVDQLRCYELWDLVGQLGHLTGSLLEVGVWRGGTGALISQRASELPGKPVTYLCDTFKGVVKASEKDSSYRGGEHADTSEQHVSGLLSRLDIQNARILVGIFPDDSLDVVKNETFRFVHIDVDVYQSAKEIFDFAWPRMPVGGVVVFDDFGFDTCDGIPVLVAEYRGDRDKLVIQNLNGHAIVVKTQQ